MRAVLKGSYKDHIDFIRLKLSEMVSDTSFEAKLGGSVAKKLIEKIGSKWREITDDGERYETSIFLGKSSNSMILGRRRLNVKAYGQDGSTIIEIIETKNSNYITIATLIGLLFCVIPGIIVLIVNNLHNNHNKKIIDKIGAKLKNEFPDCVIT